MKALFTPTEFRIPRAQLAPKWGVIACDQFTSAPEYWESVEREVGDSPSAYRCIIPEAHLNDGDLAARVQSCHEHMRAYRDSDMLFRVPACFLYVERWLGVQGSRQAKRRGLVGKLDLEAYDFRPGTDAPVRASEDTVARRLPPRVALREGAVLEFSHVMVLVDDPENTVFGPLEHINIGAHQKGQDQMPVEEAVRMPWRIPMRVYDTPLMLGGVRMMGFRIEGQRAEEVTRAVDALPGSLKIVVGDGNHSLAAAKLCWERIRQELTPEERLTHPARFAMVELCRLQDENLTLLPIHRNVTSPYLHQLWMALGERFQEGAPALVVDGCSTKPIRIPGETTQEGVGILDAFLEDWMGHNGGGIVDYIHDEEAARALACREGQLSILLPTPDKEGFFRQLERDGRFPKKSFSIGAAHEKRYYVECREL